MDKNEKVRARCPSCGAVCRCPVSRLGKPVRCPKCKEQGLFLPVMEDAPDPPAEASPPVVPPPEEEAAAPAPPVRSSRRKAKKEKKGLDPLVKIGGLLFVNGFLIAYPLRALLLLLNMRWADFYVPFFGIAVGVVGFILLIVGLVRR